MNTATKTLLALLASSLVSTAFAEKPEEILKVKKSTFVNLVDLLVQRGVINKQEGSGLVTAAEQEAADEEQRVAVQAPSGITANPELQTTASAAAETPAGKAGSKSKHVSYVPEFVKKELRDEVRAELKAEVVNDVKQDAKKEGWGIPAALPEWVANITPTFDMRLRFADELYGNNNQQNYGLGPNSGPYDWLAINNAGGMQNAQNKNQLFLNNQKDRLRIRERFRFGFDAKIADGLKAGVRLATSNMYNPVSNDQTLGNTGQSWQVAIDRAYLQYDFVDSKGTDWFTLLGGRTINPFVSTDIVFDPDLSFEGVTGSFRYHFNQDDPNVKNYITPRSTGRNGINQGLQTPDSVFLTMGVYPIQSVNFSAVNKWLYAGQFGADWLVFDKSRFNIATSYYEYQNISARYNTANGNGSSNDWTAPQFVQKGNSMVAITDQNSGLGTVCTDANGCLFGLASGFKIFNATAMFDYAGFDFAHVLFTADYAKNLGFNQQHILSEFHQDITPRTNAYQTRVDVGHPEIRRFGDWNVNLAYRYVERDAVLDAFTDSIFHQGGTNAKGWVLGTQYGLAKNTWLNLRWLSADAIDGPTYSIDTINADLNARF
jgi:Putative porin